MRDIFETMFSQMDQSNDHFRQTVEFQKSIFMRYREQIAKEMSHDPLGDMMADLSRTMMSTALEMAAYQRESRKRLLQMQASFAETYLNLLDRMCANPPNGAPSEAAPTPANHGTENAK